MDIKLIPERYILKRWTREAKSESVEDTNGRVVLGDVTLDLHDITGICAPN